MTKRNNDETVNFMSHSDNVSIGSVRDYSNVFLFLQCR